MVCFDHDLNLGGVFVEEKIYQFITELMEFKPKVWRRIQISSKLNIEDLMDVMMVIFECQFAHLYELTLPKGENDYNRKKRAEPEADIELIRNDFVYPCKTSISKFDISEDYRAYMHKMEKEFLAEKFSFREYFSHKNQTEDMISEILEAGIDEKIIDFDTAKALIEFEKSKVADFEKEIVKNKPKYSYKDAADLIESLDLEVDDKLYFAYDFGDGWEFKLKLEKILDTKEVNDPHIPRVLTGKCFGIIEDVGGSYGLEEFIKADNSLEEFKYYYKSDHNPVFREMFGK